MFLDNYVLNGQPHGEIAQMVAGPGVRFDPGLHRPFIGSQGRRYVTLNTGRGHEPRLIQDLQAQGINLPVHNAATLLRKDDWLEIDKVVLKAARARLRAWADLASSNSVGGFNGMAKPIFEYETMSDPGEAVVDMDALSDGRRDTPKFQIEGIPLPITHSDFHFSARQLAAAQNSGTPLDMTMAEAAGRRVAETIEQTLIGTVTGMTYGDQTGRGYSRAPTVYGYTNFPARNTKTDLTAPTGSNPEAIMTDVLEMRDQLYNDNFFGPFVLYHSTGYDLYLDNDYYRTGSTAIHRTLRERIEAIEGISAVRRLDYLTSGYVMILVQMTSDVARAINGMDLTTVQWPTVGGMRQNFKVMTIAVPQIRADFDGRCGVVHGTTA